MTGREGTGHGARRRWRWWDSSSAGLYRPGQLFLFTRMMLDELFVYPHVYPNIGLPAVICCPALANAHQQLYMLFYLPA